MNASNKGGKLDSNLISDFADLPKIRKFMLETNKFGRKAVRDDIK